jgi:hypothetical protein
MSQDILATITRDNVLLSGDPAAIELHFASDMEQHGSGGIRPYYRYLCIVWQILDLKQNDYLQDTLTTDPVTGTATTYQVVSMPETFTDGHMEFKADSARITGFS